MTLFSEFGNYSLEVRIMTNKIVERRSFKLAAKAVWVAILFLAGFQLLAYDGALYPDLLGKWSYKLSTFNFGSYGLTAAEKDAFAKDMQELAAVFHETPVLSSPKGIDADASADLDLPCAKDSCKQSRVKGKLGISLVFFCESKDGKPMRAQSGNASFTVFTNLQEVLASKNSLWYNGMRDEQGNEIFFEPKKVKDVDGFPLYENGMMVIAKNNKPVWVPATVEQFLKLIIRDLKAEVEKSYKNLPPEMAAQQPENPLSAMVKNMEAELAGLSPEKRKAPAYFISQQRMMLGPPIVDKSEPDARPLVMVNPDYFDKSLPRTAVQLIVISWSDIPNYGFVAPSFQEAPPESREFEVLNTLDYKKLAGLLK